MEKIDNEEFKKRVRDINGDRYDLSETNFIDPKTKVKIVCNSCGEEIYTDPVKLLAGIGCKDCYGTTYLNTQTFIDRSNAIYGDDAFDYSEVEYKNFHKKVKIRCNRCGMSFWRRLSVHLQDCECPYCHCSDGEKRIWKFLDNYNIRFEKEKSFFGLEDDGLLRYDFYLPDYDTVIEYNDIWHYETGYNNTQKSQLEFKKKHHRDEIKLQYAHDNGLKMIVIPYTECDKIDTILREVLKLPVKPLHVEIQDPDPVLKHFEDESELKRVAMNCASYLWEQLKEYDKDKRDFILSTMNALLRVL